MRLIRLLRVVTDISETTVRTSFTSLAKLSPAAFTPHRSSFPCAAPESASPQSRPYLTCACLLTHYAYLKRENCLLGHSLPPPPCPSSIAINHVLTGSPQQHLPLKPVPRPWLELVGCRTSKPAKQDLRAVCESRQREPRI
jgi:hypothetical protein